MQVTINIVMRYWTKTVSKTKANVEAELQNISARLGFSPYVLSVSEKEHFSIIRMERVDGVSLADKYGEDPSKIPDWIWNKIRYMLACLIDNQVEYVDITPYNFMELEDDIKIIDFGDANYSNGNNNWFLEEFLDGLNEWNPDFK